MFEKGIDWALFGAVIFGLSMFGLAYNALIHALGRRKDGYVSLLVVGGVLVTLGGLAFINWRAALIALGCFSASGLPMVLGDIYRAISARERAVQEMRDEARKAADEIYGKPS